MEASQWQLLFYLKILKDANIKAKGVLQYPEERKRIDVELDEEKEAKLNMMIDEIEAIIDKPSPPVVEKINMCRNCAYKEYCYS